MRPIQQRRRENKVFEIMMLVNSYRNMIEGNTVWDQWVHNTLLNRIISVGILSYNRVGVIVDSDLDKISDMVDERMVDEAQSEAIYGNV